MTDHTSITPEELAALRRRVDRAEGLLAKHTRRAGAFKDALQRMTSSRDVLRSTLETVAHELEYGEAGLGDLFELGWLKDDARRALKESRRHAK